MLTEEMIEIGVLVIAVGAFWLQWQALRELRDELRLLRGSLEDRPPRS